MAIFCDLFYIICQHFKVVKLTSNFAIEFKELWQKDELNRTNLLAGLVFFGMFFSKTPKNTINFEPSVRLSSSFHHKS